MRRFILATVALVIVGGAQAVAQSSSTSCFTNGTMTNCNTYAYPNNGGGGALAGFAQGLHESGALNGLGARIREQRAEHAKQKRYETAGKLIAAGQCDEARSFALTSGDLDLAERVAGLCPVQPAQ